MKIIKLSNRSGTPEAFDPDRKSRDPYRKPKPGDGEGMKLNTPGEGTGFGTRFRGKDGPKVPSNLEDQDTGADLPVSPHLFIPSDDTDDEVQMGEGANDGRFFDPESPLSNESTSERLRDEALPGVSRINGIPTSKKSPMDIYKSVALKQNKRLF